jgi:hypothetical protein
MENEEKGLSGFMQLSALVGFPSVEIWSHCQFSEERVAPKVGSMLTLQCGCCCVLCICALVPPNKCVRERPRKCEESELPA